MPRRRRLSNPIAPLAELAVKTAEIATASSFVVSHRTQRILNAGSSPNARDRREFTRMGQEKIDAAVESSQAMAVAATSLALEMAAAWQAWLRLPTQLMTGSSGQDAARAVARLADAAARVGTAGVAPVHSRATANAKRLGKPSGRRKPTK